MPPWGISLTSMKCVFTQVQPYCRREAHSARYDTEKTAELFCGIVNSWKQMGGWKDFND